MVGSPPRSAARQPPATADAEVYEYYSSGVDGHNRGVNEGRSLSPPRGVVFGTAALATLTDDVAATPGPGEYTPAGAGRAGPEYSGSAAGSASSLRAQQVHTGTMPRDARFKGIPASPGPGEYLPQDGRAPAAKAGGGGVIGSEELARLQYPRPSPGPCCYSPRAGAQPQPPLGTMAKAARDVTSPVERARGADRAAFAPLSPTSAARRTASVPTFGTSQRFVGPTAHVPKNESPGPGQYSHTVRAAYPQVAGSPRRSRTPVRTPTAGQGQGRLPSPVRPPATASPKTPSQRAARPSAAISPKVASAQRGGAAPMTPQRVAAAVSSPSKPGTPTPTGAQRTPGKAATPPAQRISQKAGLRFVSSGKQAPPRTPPSTTKRSVTVAPPPAEPPQPARRAPAEKPGERAWKEFARRCAGLGLGEAELGLLSLDTLKALVKELQVADVVEAARIEVHWRQLQLGGSGGGLTRVAV
eukprot:TRINITY_DN7771_c0_g1_i1.p1 TRINITY_DN7771_c0_g1~~TRINITY_DN7771_c0_g1_i1.p1  ORF type:complete len:471 (+),score=101.52 TRINITY_DN7771_c0_g1_i1:67-1479(+)